jgi:hypothetical protein
LLACVPDGNDLTAVANVLERIVRDH